MLVIMKPDIFDAMLGLDDVRSAKPETTVSHNFSSLKPLDIFNSRLEIFPTVLLAEQNYSFK